MKRSIIALLASGIAGVSTTNSPDLRHFSRQHPDTEPAHDVSQVFNSGETSTIQGDFHDWVNPEDVFPMPQCIAQQDRSAWLHTMSMCTHQRCTSHFGFICTRRRWLTQLSCLSVEFSPNAIENYVSYCSRSILAKAQLHHWIRTVTDRTWLVDVGDANGLQTLSPADLAKGYASMGVASKAPACLSHSPVSPPLESFEHVLGSCSFTSTTLHTGNAARPWEYSGSRKSIVALSFDTAGYDLTGTHIPSGEYFDRECFCSAFSIDQKGEPCVTSGQLELTMERLWLNATCGPASLPENWTALLKVMGSEYFPLADWHWPQHVSDMPKEVTDLTIQCATDACQLDADGYCVVGRAMDRACFCSQIDYNACQASCRIFESRIGFVKWLHEMCGNLDGWHGLPTNWRELTTPLPGEMIPWRWVVRPNNDSTTIDQCWSNKWKLGSIALVNLTSFLAVIFARRCEHQRLTTDPPLLRRLPWMMGSTLLACLHLSANWINGRIIQSTPGYEAVPVFQLMLLWCSLPRLSWLTITPAGFHRPAATELSSAAFPMFAEMILQGFALYPMSLTVNYGRQHNFYLGGLANAKSERVAMFMYVGALAWLSVIALSAVAMWVICRTGRLGKSVRGRHGDGVFETLLPKSWTTYGTLPSENKHNNRSQETFAGLCSVVAITLPLLWISQWVFWIGFINLSLEKYVLTPQPDLQ